MNKRFGGKLYIPIDSLLLPGGSTSARNKYYNSMHILIIIIGSELDRKGIYMM